MNITGVILARNEESKIKTALESLRFCDELLVFDDGSTDSTQKIAKECNAKIIEFPVSKSFANARNEAMKLASHEWIFFLDADETVTPELMREIQQCDRSKDAYVIPRRDFFWNTELRWGETRTARTKGIVRLVKKGRGSWVGFVHEVFACFGHEGKLSGFINHHPHQSIAEFVRDINAYSTLRVREIHKKSSIVSTLELVLYPFGKFIYTYFIKLGCLDGPAGFVYSFIMAFHSFLVRSKLITLYD